MSLLCEFSSRAKAARALLLAAAAALGGCGSNFAAMDCQARCGHQPEVRDYHGCYKACHMSTSSCR